MRNRLLFASLLIVFVCQTGGVTAQANVMLSLDYTGDWLVNILNNVLPPDADPDTASSVVVDAEPETAEAWKRWSVADNFKFGKNRGSLSMINDLDALHPYFRDQVRELIARCKAKGIELAVVETFRTHAKQNEYKGMGKKYTNSAGGKSKHQYGLAVDVVPIVNGIAVWDNALLWKRIGPIGERLGLRWGGRWKHPYDPGHFEWTGGLTSVHLSTGQLPVVPTDAYPCIHEDIETLRVCWHEWEVVQSATTRR